MTSHDTEPRVERIVLHIGTEKTGTSSIQQLLSKNRGALAAEGIVYPAFTGQQGNSQWGFVAAVADSPWKFDFGARLGIRDQTSAAAYRARLIEAIDGELLACPGRHTLLISSEHFHSRLRNPRVIGALKTLLARWSDNVQVVLYLRRQDRLAVSHYSTKLKSGKPNPRVFPWIEEGSLPYYFDYERLYENWCTVFGEAAVQAALYRKEAFVGGDLLSDFCHRVGMEGLELQRPARANPSLSEHGLALLKELNRQWPKDPLGHHDPERARLVVSISREHRGRSFPCSRAEAEAFYAHFAPGNARLAARAFPQRGGEPFDRTFNDYPEIYSPVNLEVEEAVRRLVALRRPLASVRQTVGLRRRLATAKKRLPGVSGGLLGAGRDLLGRAAGWFRRRS